MIRILIIEHDLRIADAYRNFFKTSDARFDCRFISSFDEAERMTAGGEADIIVSCFRVGPQTIVSLFRTDSIFKSATARAASIPVIVTGFADEAADLNNAIAAGAADYIIKDAECRFLECLPHTLISAIQLNKYRLEGKRSGELIRKYQEVIEQNPVSIIITNAGGIIEYANSRFFKSSGYQADEIISRHVSILDNQHTNYIQTGAIQAIMQHTGWEGQVLSIRKNGECYWESVHIKPVIDSDGLVANLLIMKTDISEQKEMERILREINDELDMRVRQKTMEIGITNEELQQEIRERMRIEEELRESEEKFRTFIETASDFMHITNEHGKFTYVNASMIRALGYSREEFYTKHISEIFDDQTFRSFKPKYEKLIQKGDIRFDAILITRDRHRLFGEMIVVAAYGNMGEYLGTRGIFRNLTERKKAEEESRKLEEQLERVRKMETIGALAGGIAHDFNNMLTPILGLAELALMDIREGNAGYEEITEVVKAAKRAKSLVQEILAFSRKVEQKRKFIGINNIINEALRLVTATIPPTIEIKTMFEPACGFISAVPSQIHQVIMNICVNAVHAMKDRIGAIEISSGKTVFSEERKIGLFSVEKGNYVRVRIKDSGCGMNTETMKHIFEPFFTTKGTNEGTGLGLAVVHGIISNHKGAIDVESESGTGTTFTIYLPCCCEAPDEKAEPEISYAAKNEHLLIVDDDEQVASASKKMLESIGYRITKETSPLKALEVFRENPAIFDLIITDMMMPKMTGIQLAGEIRKLNFSIPIILTTGSVNKVKKEECEKLGLNSLLLKPFTMQELSEKVRETIRQEQSRA